MTETVIEVVKAEEVKDKESRRRKNKDIELWVG